MIDDDEVRRIGGALGRLIARALRILPVDVVEDAAQESWLRFLRVAGRPCELDDDYSRRSAYLMGIFRKVCADFARRFHRRRRSVCLESEMGGSMPDKAGVSRDPCGSREEEVQAAIRRGLQELRATDINLWVLARVEGVGWKAAGRALGIGNRDVGRARQRILRFMSSGVPTRRFLADLGLEEPRRAKPFSGSDCGGSKPDKPI